MGYRREARTGYLIINKNDFYLEYEEKKETTKYKITVVNLKLLLIFYGECFHFVLLDLGLLELYNYHNRTTFIPGEQV